MTYIRTHRSKLELEDSPTRLASKLKLTDIAKSLSRQARYNGSTSRFYSVAEHSIILARWVASQPWSTPKDVKTTLLHDASEMITGDIPRPVKQYLGERLSDLEKRLDEAVSIRFDTHYPFPTWLKEIDLGICRIEIMSMFPNQDEADLKGLPEVPDLAKIMFLDYGTKMDSLETAFINEFDKWSNFRALENLEEFRKRPLQDGCHNCEFRSGFKCLAFSARDPDYIRPWPNCVTFTPQRT